MKAIRIGRSRRNDVVIGDARVSREHAELVATRDGRYYLTDCNSAHGTLRCKDGVWTPIRQDYVSADEPLRFGPDHETTARALMAAADQRRAPTPLIDRRTVETVDGRGRRRRVTVASSADYEPAAEDEIGDSEARAPCRGAVRGAGR